MSNDNERCEQLPLAKAALYLLEECRMVLPGIQALFGFQLVAVFSAAFSQKLDTSGQRLHLLAIALTAVAIALVMSPAAYHRQTRPQEISETFIRVSTRLLLWSMLPLAVSICMEFYLISRVILSSTWAPIVTAVLFVIYLLLWFVLPRARALQGVVRRHDQEQ